MKKYILDKKEEIKSLEVKERLIEFPKTKNLIISVIGPRRAGKTFLLYSIIKKNGLKDEDYVFVNFEDDEVKMMKREEKIKMLSFHQEIYGKEPSYIFLDEIQSLEGWQSFVYSLYEKKRYYIFVTGSTSKFLSKEIATQLRGRSLGLMLLPFSFKEILMLNGIEIKKYYSTREEAKIKNLLSKYLKDGGFPLVVIENMNKKLFFRDYVDVVIQKDILERYNIRNVAAIKYLINSTIASFAKEFSINKVFNTLKSIGIKVSKNSLYSYISALEDAMFCFFLKKFSYSMKQTELSIPKIYLNDPGYAEIFLADKEQMLGRLMENVVFLELKRRESLGKITSIFYYKENGNEVDFVIKEGIRANQLIQVTYANSKDEIDKREIRALLKASQQLKCKNLLCLTWDYEAEERHKGKKIKFVPLWKWLVE
jgi:predicted AAA+ superfamily ATPase